jgi:hypothetical protein
MRSCSSWWPDWLNERVSEGKVTPGVHERAAHCEIRARVVVLKGSPCWAVLGRLQGVCMLAPQHGV